MRDAAERTAAVDWSTAPAVEVALSEYKYMPDTLSFRRGEPYRLRLANTGNEAHDITSPAFFKAFAAWKLISKDGEITAPALQTIGLNRGDAKELDFVAVQPGTYPFRCDEPLHALFGMKGSAIIN